MITAASASNATLSHCLALFAIAWEDFFFFRGLALLLGQKEKKKSEPGMTYMSPITCLFLLRRQNIRVVKLEVIRSGSVAFSALLEKIQGNLAKFYDTKEKLPGNVYHYTAQ